MGKPDPFITAPQLTSREGDPSTRSAPRADQNCISVETLTFSFISDCAMGHVLGRGQLLPDLLLARLALLVIEAEGGSSVSLGWAPGLPQRSQRVGPQRSSQAAHGWRWPPEPTSSQLLGVAGRKAREREVRCRGPTLFSARTRLCVLGRLSPWSEAPGPLPELRRWGPHEVVREHVGSLIFFPLLFSPHASRPVVPTLPAFPLPVSNLQFCPSFL